MVYANTSLKNSQARNKERSRQLPSRIVQKDWEVVQKNVQGYKTMFGKDFLELKNDDTFAELKKKSDKLYGAILQWTNRFPSNKLAVAWKEFELLKKAQKSKPEKPLPNVKDAMWGKGKHSTMKPYTRKFT